MRLEDLLGNDLYVTPANMEIAQKPVIVNVLKGLQENIAIEEWVKIGDITRESRLNIYILEKLKNSIFLIYQKIINAFKIFNFYVLTFEKFKENAGLSF